MSVPPFAESPSSTSARGVPAFSQSETNGLEDVVPTAQARGVRLTMEEAILHTLVYADLFDYPLTTPEIHRYLTGRRASLPEVEEYLAQKGPTDGRFASIPPYWYLDRRHQLVRLRREREAFSQALWPQAKRYGRLMAAVPFVRMVAITGSLAMNNVSDEQDDIDFLIATVRNRVWLARGIVILVVHLAQQHGLELCPNYVIAEHQLQLGEGSLFTAHELAQIIPLRGIQVYKRLMESNAWITDYLPNVTPRSAGEGEMGGAAQRGQHLMETMLGGGLGDMLERWESGRKIPRLRRTAEQRGAAGAIFTPVLCKGHMDDHTDDVRQRFAEGLAAQGIEPNRAWVRP